MQRANDYRPYRENEYRLVDELSLELAEVRQRIAHRYSWARWFLRIIRLVFRKPKVSTPKTVVTLHFYENSENFVTIRVLHKGKEWYHHTSRGVMALDKYSIWVSNKGDSASLAMSETLGAFTKAKYLSSKFKRGGSNESG